MSMFSELANKFHTFSGHHQIFITALVAVTIIVASWAIEKILEEILPRKITSYIYTLLMSFFLLLIIKHFILHVW